MLLFNTISLSSHMICVISDFPGDEFFVIRIFHGLVTESSLFGLFVLQSFFFCFILLMLITQLNVVAFNMNTNEQINLRRYTHFWQPTPSSSDSSTSVSFKNPFDKGVIRNCLYFWTGDTASYSQLTIPRMIGNICCDHPVQKEEDVELHVL